MTAVRTFELTIEGETFFCLAFPSAAAREQAIGANLAEVESERARKRQEATQLAGRDKDGEPLRSPPRGGDRETGSTAEIIAKKLGIGENTVQRRGRPSFDGMLAAAMEALGPQLDPSLTLAERRRRVLRYLATSGMDPEEIPSRTTTENYLAAHPAPEKVAGKVPGKSAGAKIAVTGGG